MKRALPYIVGLFIVVATLGGCGDKPSTPIAPDQPKADPGPPKNMDQMMHAHDNGPKH